MPRLRAPQRSFARGFVTVEKAIASVGLEGRRGSLSAVIASAEFLT